MMQEQLHSWQPRAFQEDTKQSSMFAVGIIFILITSLVVGLRIFVRVSLLPGGLGVDDYLMVAGTVCTISLSVANMICGWYGAGVHVSDIPAENMVPLLKADYATRLLYVVALCFVKFSILVFYMRLDHRKFTRYIIYFLMFNVGGLSIATFFILMFVCSPPSLFWNPQAQALHPQACMAQDRQQVFFNANGILNIIQDTGIYILPIPMLWQLQMRRRQKAAVIALLCVGFLAVAAGCVRFYYVLFLAHENDLWWYMADSLNWCSIEIYTAIICGSASTFQALLKTYLPRVWGSRGSQRDDSGYQRHQYNSSRSGQFAIAPYPKKDPYNITVGHGSEEAIVPSANDNPGRITVSKELTMHVENLP